MEEARELHTHWLHRHSHLSGTLDSLNDVDCPLLSGLLPGPSWWGEGNPPGREGWWGEDPPEGAVLLTPQEVEPQTQQPAPNEQQEPYLARDLLGLQHMRTQQNRHRSPQNEERGTPDHRLGDCMGLVTAGKGERGLASDFSRSTQSQTINKIKAPRGQDSKEDRR